ncbi:MAG: L-aspartate oxidase [Lachnospiraceae bacterium]
MDTEYEVIIVGTGAAGLFAALSLPRNTKILMITKEEVKHSDSYLAQGGISVLKNDEDYDIYFEDTMRAGRFENCEQSVEVMLQASREIIKELVSYGVEFDRDANGEPAYTREGGHTVFRILHHKDVTGKEITSKLIHCVLQRNNIHIKEYTTMIDLIEADNTCQGIVVEENDGTRQCIYAKATILATGGIGGLFENSTNFRHISGDSFAIALGHHVELEDIDYIQIHPTTLYSKKEGRRFLISESVRGEGAVLLNEEGNRFVDELLPRDIVTDAIKKEMDKYHMPYVYLSMMHMSKKEIEQRFPNIYQRCLEEGYDLSKEPIPVTPAQHYLMGGIHTDTQGQTSMKHLYAVGETACNGVHGRNRLASNSLLESLVFSKRGAESIAKEIKNVNIAKIVVDTDSYPNQKMRKENSRRLIMEEIQRRDGEFYAKWCDSENQHR